MRALLGATRPGCVPYITGGLHLARYQRAERRGVIDRQALVSVVANLDVIAAGAVVEDGAR